MTPGMPGGELACVLLDEAECEFCDATVRWHTPV